ncbi:alpha/beta fold hydrolase [Methylocella silvestris]|uniref:AB hydrolase-1 domain-containing protein n=1 Tax=Methylocella silvestris TaxID=199596 RepID=A0A2J7THH2_METSI|nr:alpha/beta fold hydrolase [Methylocella silvestris]PNG26213.1 hypothetical protein CR492_08795 [Methylocella silvestris]
MDDGELVVPPASKRVGYSFNCLICCAMSRLIKIANWGGGQPRASVVFVHGLGGHVYDTWRRNPDDDTFWPTWLAQDVRGITVYALVYGAPPSNWLGTAMPLQDRAVNILEVLLSEPALRTAPIIFVCHSLGGLLIKQIMLDLERQKGRRPEAKELLECVSEIVFLATPHTGSRQGSWIDRLRFIAWPTSIARTLVANDPTLRAINVAYRGLADDRRDILKHRIFYETRGTPAGVIVDEASADPGLPGDPPVPVDADHILITKPLDRFSIAYARTRDFVEKMPLQTSQEGPVELLPLQEIKRDRRLNLIPKILRIIAAIAFVVLVILIAYKGVQALIAPSPPIDQRAIERKVQEADDASAERHREVMASQDLLRLQMAREQGVPPEVLKPLFDNLGMQGLTRDEMREKASDAIQAILAQANQKAKPSQVGADVDKTIAASRAKLASLDTAGAQALLDRQIAEEEKTAAAGRQRLISLLAEKADVARIAFDYPAAKAALEHLVRLDPDRVWSWIDLGDIWTTTGPLGEAEKAFRAAAEAARRTKDEHDLGASYDRIGSVKQALGDLAGALKSYSDSRGITEALAKSDPGNAGWRRELSVSCERIGDVQQAQGDLAGALKSYSESRDITEALVKSDPGNAGWQRDLSLSYEKLGDVQMARGDLAGALKSYLDTLAIVEALTKSDPGNAGWGRDLSVSHSRIGDVQQAQGDLAGALKSYSDSLDIAEALAKSDPSSSVRRRDLAISLGNIGDVQQEQGDLVAAMKSYSNGLLIFEALVKSDPSNAGWRRDISASYNAIGYLQQTQGDLVGALKSYSYSLSITQALANSDPSNAVWRRDLIASYGRIGEAMQTQGDLTGALRSYLDTLAIAEALTKSDPSNAGWWRDLGVAHFKVGSVKQGQGDLAGALKSFKGSVATFETLANSTPSNDGWRRDLAVSLGKLGNTYGILGNSDEAIKALNRGRAIVASLVGLSNSDARWTKSNLDWFDELIREQGQRAPR